MGMEEMCNCEQGVIEEGEPFIDDDFPMYLEYTDWMDDLPGAADVW